LKPADDATKGVETVKRPEEPKPIADGPVTDFRDDPRMEAVYEKLIELYRSRDRSDWKKLITLSTKWPDMADGVFQRIERKSADETDPAKKLEWLQFGKSLFNVHREIERYDELVAKFMSTERLEWEAVVAERRREMTPEFFEHLQRLVMAGGSEPDKQEELKTMASALVSMVEMYDQAVADKRSLDYAKDAVQDVLAAETVEDADHRIDELASSGGLDGAFLLTVAKMYMSVKESPYTKEETKDVMYHLYIKAKETASAMQPPEVRILKYLLSIDDPVMLKQAIFDAFTPGKVISDSVDYLSTTPADLLKTLDTVLSAYESHRGKHTMLGETSTMMNPDLIQRMQKLEAYIKKEFM